MNSNDMLGLGKHLVAACALAGLAAGSVGAETPARPLDFATALELLERQNESLAAERQVLGQTRAEFEQAKGRRWPELGLVGGYTRMSEPIEIGLDPVRRILLHIDPDLPTALLPRDVRVQKRQFGTAGVRATWPVYTGGRVSAGINAAEAAVAAGQAELDGTEGGMRLALVERYFSQVLADQAYQLKAASAETLADHHQHALLLQAQGQIARAEVLRAEVALSEARRERDSARHDFILASAALAALLASDQRYRTVTAIPEPSPLPALDPLVTAALEHNPILRAAREQLVRAEAGVKAAQGERLPTVALFGQRELYTRDLDLFDPEWVVGVMFNWSLFDGGTRRGGVSAAQLKADEVAYRVAAGRRDVELLVREYHNQLADALGRIESFTTTRELAMESLRAQRRAFEEGLASSLDVVDAELALQRVELGMLAARYESLVARAGLFEATGRAYRIGEMFTNPLQEPVSPVSEEAAGERHGSEYGN